MSSVAEKRQVFYTNMLLLGFEGTAPPQYNSRKTIAFNVDMFKVPNRSAFEVVTLFLFTKLNPTRAKEEFRDCWPTLDKKREQVYRRVCNDWLAQIAQDEADSHLPKIVPSIFQSPGGDRFCSLMFSFSNYVLTHVIKHEHGMRARDILLKPMLSPQNMEFAAAMTQSVQCSAISERKKFFQRIQTREALHKTWQKSASEMVRDYRKLSPGLRQREADIRSLLDQHSEKGFRSPVRRDKLNKSLTPASKHGRLLDVNVESVRREEKIQKVRELWKTVEGFLSATESQREIVSSILSGVIHKYVLNASDLDLRVPEMLLRECERELLQRDIGNTYKAGKLDLVSILNLWNLSMHLYLERFEDGERLDLSNQLKDIKPKLDGMNAQLDDSRQLCSSLKDELIPEIKESIRQLKARYDSREHKEYKSQLDMTFQPDTPPLSFDPNKASDADVQAARMTFTPDMLPQESTPEAVSRIIQSVNRAMQPQRLVCKDLTNQQSDNNSCASPSLVISPLAQGKPIRTRHMDLVNSSFGESTRSAGGSPARCSSNVQVSRVGSKQVTKVLRDKLVGDSGLFSSPDDTPKVSNNTTDDTALRKGQATTPVSSRVTQLSGRRDIDSARGQLHSQVAKPAASFMSRDSPSDVLAARIAQSIIEDGDGDSVSPQLERSTVDSLYGVSSVLDELGMSGFSSRDKIGRTPDTSIVGTTRLARADDSHRGKIIFASAHKQFTETLYDEDNIITVETEETERSSYSGESSKHSLSPKSVDAIDEDTATADQQPFCPSSAPSGASNNIPGAGERSFRSQAETSGSLRGHVYWTPERCAGGAGRRIVDGVLGEEPLFLDSPTSDSFSAGDIDADLLELLAQDNSLQDSSGIRVSLGAESSPSRPAYGAEPLAKSAAPRYTLEEMKAQFEKVKQMAAAASANQQVLAAAASHPVSPANQKYAATNNASAQ